MWSSNEPSFQGSITSGATVSGVVIQNNNIVNSMQGLRIKTDSDATSASVTNVTYSGNTGTGLQQFGILIDQVSMCSPTVGRNVSHSAELS